MNLSWLAKHAFDVSGPKKMRQFAFEKFGQGVLNDLSSDDITRAEAVPDAPTAHEWRRAVAEELLLAKTIGADIPNEQIEHFTPVSPFGADGPPLGQLLDCNTGVAVIPLDGRDGPPCCTHIWLVERRDSTSSVATVPHWESLPCRLTISGAPYNVYTVRSRNDERIVTGKSWQLALELLKHALEHNDSKAIRALALDWIITGEVNGDTVNPVKLGNKLELHSERNWLLPKANKREIRDSQMARHLKGKDEYANNVTTAWNIIAGRGPRDEGKMPWVGQCEVMHSFVSAMRQPVIAAALLSSPKKLVLWHTSNKEISKLRAKDIKRILEKLTPSMEIILKQVPSDNMVDAERVLRNELENDIENARKSEVPILFNVTTGNRLMSFAAHAIAQRNSQLWLIYRDADADEFKYTMIRYDGDRNPLTYVMDGANAAGNIEDVNWTILFKKIKQRELPDWCALLKDITVVRKPPATTYQ